MQEQQQNDFDPVNVLEALLFASSEPLSLDNIKERMPTGIDLGKTLDDLKSRYQDRGVHLTEINGFWAFRTASELSEVLSLEKEVKRKLSRAAMETLAIIAYHQPVTRAEIENIRGVSTHRGTLDVLTEAGWIKPGRRRESPGRPLTWVTTNAFLDHFGLEALTDLPGLDELKSSGMLDRRPAIETVTLTPDLFEDEEGEDADEQLYDEDNNLDSEL